MRKRLLYVSRPALACYDQRLREGVRPNAATVVEALKECNASNDLDNGRRIHLDVVANGDCFNMFVANTLVDMYAKSGCMMDARKVFDSMKHPSVVSWNCIIMGHAQNGEGAHALHLFEQMEKTGIAPSRVTLLSALKACGSLAESKDLNALEKCKMIHQQAAGTGLLDVVVLSSLIDVYIKCGSIVIARHIFDSMVERDVICWTSIIRGYAQLGDGDMTLELFARMQLEGFSPDAQTFVSAAKACSISNRPKEQSRTVHLQAINSGHVVDDVVANALVDMYSKCGNVVEARVVFETIVNPDVVSWTTLIMGYVYSGDTQMALKLYHEMQPVCEPNFVTYVAALQACASMKDAENGSIIHWKAAQGGHALEPRVVCTLVDMYAKCGRLYEARSTFEEVDYPHVAAWTSLITGYAEAGETREAFNVYTRMRKQGFEPNAITLLATLKATNGAEECKAVHSEALELGLMDCFLANALLDTYAKSGSMVEANEVFNSMKNPDVVSWSTLIMGYARTGQWESALQVYRICPVLEAAIFVAALKACAGFGVLEQAKQVHAAVSQQGLHKHVQVANSLVDCYGKCGSMSHALEVFDTVTVRSLVTWSALIEGYSRQADAQRVLESWDAMRRLDPSLLPDDILLLSVLTACSHAGRVSEATSCFEAMTGEFGITPRVQHFACMIDLHGRLGRFEDALALLRTMPFDADQVVWTAVLGACRKWNNVGTARLAFQSLLYLDNDDNAAVILMGNIYGSVGMWEERERMLALWTTGKTSLDFN